MSASALLDNVTTVLLVAPVTILICQRLALPAVPYLIAEVFASSIGGTATLVGDPPHIIIATLAFFVGLFVTTTSRTSRAWPRSWRASSGPGWWSRSRRSRWRASTSHCATSC